MEQVQPSGNILASASNVVITGGTFVGSQNVNNVTGDNHQKILAEIYGRAAPNAVLNAGGRADPVSCFPGTREEVLAKIEAWIDAGKQSYREAQQGGIFWLSGPAGAGKSAIIQTLAERCTQRRVPMVNFFFFRGDYSRNSSTRVTATLLGQLIELFPTMKPTIADVLMARPMIYGQPIGQQFRYLIRNPFSNVKLAADSHSHWPIVILVDGLDECDLPNKQVQREILRALHVLVSSANSPFLILVASRPEPHLTMAFNEIGSHAGSIFLDTGGKSHRTSI